jgi:WD40 repeat protein
VNGSPIAFDPSGRLLTAARRNSEVTLWDVATGGHLLTLKGHQASVESVTFSPDGTLLAASSGNGTIRLWPAATQKELKETGW